MQNRTQIKGTKTWHGKKNKTRKRFTLLYIITQWLATKGKKYRDSDKGQEVSQDTMSEIQMTDQDILWLSGGELSMAGVKKVHRSQKKIKTFLGSHLDDWTDRIINVLRSYLFPFKYRLTHKSTCCKSRQNRTLSSGINIPGADVIAQLAPLG